MTESSCGTRSARPGATTPGTISATRPDACERGGAVWDCSAASGASLVSVNGEAALTKIVGMARDLPDLQGVIEMTPGQGAPPSYVTMGKLKIFTISQVTAHPATPPIAGSRDDLATLIYTSGTTGPSKGAM